VVRREDLEVRPVHTVMCHDVRVPLPGDSFSTTFYNYRVWDSISHLCRVRCDHTDVRWAERRQLRGELAREFGRCV
jgi:hypothetical protein